MNAPPRLTRSQAKLEDVAALAGVAKSTVSRILIGEKTLNIRPETRQRVLDAVAELSYRPNKRARSLRTQQSFSIGLVVGEIDNPAFTTIIQGAQRAVLEHDYSLLISYVDEHYPDRELYRRLVNDNQVGGLLVTTIQNPGLTQDLKDLGVPYVLVNRLLEDDPAHTVIVDYQSGTRDAVMHLAGLGHRRIGYVSGPLDRYTGLTRLAGFKAGLAESGLPFEATLIEECDYSRPRAEAAMQRLMDHPEGPPSAVCAANVVISSGILGLASRMGLSVPRDLSVVALLDSSAAEMLTPSITAVRYPFFELGHAAASDLIALIESRPDQHPARVLAPTGIIQRQSTQAK